MREGRAEPTALLDDLLAANAAAEDLVLLARQVWALARALREGIDVVTGRLPSAERPVLNALDPVSDRLLLASAKTLEAMTRRRSHAESTGKVLQRQFAFVATARELDVAEQVCDQIRNASWTAEAARPFVDAVHEALADEVGEFARQSADWCRLREVLHQPDREGPVREVFLAALPEPAAVPDPAYELGHISRDVEVLHDVERRVQAQVRLARKLGASWVKIGQAAAITPQGAYRRWDEEGHRRGRPR